jgi:hypothetical protein
MSSATETQRRREKLTINTSDRNPVKLFAILNLLSVSLSLCGVINYV